MSNKPNSYSLKELMGKIVAVIRYVLAFLSNRKKNKEAKIDLKKAREYEGVMDDLDKSYKKIDKKKNRKKKKDIEKRLDNMF